MATGKERRRFERFGLDEARIVLSRRGITTLFGHRENLALGILDLSEGGAQITACENLEIGSRVRVELQLPKFGDRFAAEAIVRWSRPVSGNGTHGLVLADAKETNFRLGLQFMKLTDEDWRKIAYMRSWFTSPQFAARKKAKETNTSIWRRAAAKAPSSPPKAKVHSAP